MGVPDGTDVGLTAGDGLGGGVLLPLTLELADDVRDREGDLDTEAAADTLGTGLALGAPA